MTALTHLQRLEAESIDILREAVAGSERPVMLYSLGKDSSVMLRLARKAFFPSKLPFPLLHVDTTWELPEMTEFRDRVIRELGLKLLVHVDYNARARGINPSTQGSEAHTDVWKTQGLEQAFDKHAFDLAFDGARRDEEKSTAKERIFSFRSEQQEWEPRLQRPELWRLYNARKARGERIRVLPLANWTELDIWHYIYRENIPVAPPYFAKERFVVVRDGLLTVNAHDRTPIGASDLPVMRSVRFRSLRCYPLTGAIESRADTVATVIEEVLLARTAERKACAFDHDARATKERNKREGFF